MYVFAAKSWKSMALRGIVALLLATFAFVEPKMAFNTLLLGLAGYAVADGAITLFIGLSHGGTRFSWGLPLEGALNVALGVFAFVFTSSAGLALVTAVGAWALITGIVELWICYRLRKDLVAAGILSLAGLASVALGGLFLMLPTSGSLVLVFFVGAYAAAFGAAMLGLALRLRHIDRLLRRAALEAPAPRWTPS